jgi:ATP-dependent RNA helicase DDX5/DBP2
LIKFEKNFYIEHPDVAAMPEEEAERFRKLHNLHSEGRDVPKPIQTFLQSGFPGMFGVLFCRGFWFQR